MICLVIQRQTLYIKIKMNSITSLFTFLLFFTVSISSAQQIKTVWLDDLDVARYSTGIRPVAVKGSYAKETPLRINGKTYKRGISGISISILSFKLNKNAKHFSALVGPDDAGNKEIGLRFYVIGDKKILFQTRSMKIGDEPIPVEIDLTGITQMGLLVTDSVGGVNNKRTYCDWLDAKFEMLGDFIPENIEDNAKKYILTPESPATPKINTAPIFGATPGNPVLFTIAATGNRPIQFDVNNLPKGLNIDKKTGRITGIISQRGSYKLELTATNKLGKASKPLTIIIGDTIALTPPIGWNGWNAWETNLDREKVLASADAMVKTGLVNHGWSYINIDDAWQGVRGGDLMALQPNEKFPQFKEMVDYIHSLGLKAGLYSTPYVASYGGYVGASSDNPNGGETHDSIMLRKQYYHHIGKYQFEDNDAKQMAIWGFDFLKYDWRIDVGSTKRMSDALKNSGRDVVFSLSNNAPFEKVADWVKFSNMYRTGPDIKDSWNSLFQTAFSVDRWSPYAGHGHWSDLDMMIVGNVSIGPILHPTKLTPDEQYSHVSIFSIAAAPLLIGCPIEQLDKFTLSLLSNDEIIAINQDALGNGGRLVKEENGFQIWVKPLEHGEYAVGIFNIDYFGQTPVSYFKWGNEKARIYNLDLSKIGLVGKWKIRDLWRQKDLGIYTSNFTSKIPHHGVVVLRLSQIK
jgi:alpha-galactosidase